MSDSALIHSHRSAVRTTEDILASLPQPRVVTERRRACYIVVGKPGSGKSTIAARLAQRLNSVLVDVDKVTEELVREEKEVSCSIMMVVFKMSFEIDLTENVRFCEFIDRGYVSKRGVNTIRASSGSG